MVEAALLFLVSFLGCMIQGVTGFGYAIVAMSVLPFIMPFKTATVIVALLALVMTTQISYRLRRHIRIKTLIIPLLTSILGRTVGVLILEKISTSMSKIIVGGVLIIFSLWLIYFSHKVKIKIGIISGCAVGLISGVLGGVCNVAGPPLAAYFYIALNEKNEYNATTQATFVLSGIYGVLLHAYYGNITVEVVKLLTPGAIGAFLGGYFGLIVFNKINRSMVGNFICSFTLIMGSIMLISGFK